jgi:hypothetical protein
MIIRLWTAILLADAFTLQRDIQGHIVEYRGLTAWGGDESVTVSVDPGDDDEVFSNKEHELTDTGEMEVLNEHGEAWVFRFLLDRPMTPEEAKVRQVTRKLTNGS